MKSIDLEDLSPPARDALKDATPEQLVLLEEWSAPLAPLGEHVLPEKLSVTQARHAEYEARGHVFLWPPRARCRRCGKPSCWTHHELGPDHPWLCTDGV